MCHCGSQGAVRRLSSSPRGGFSNTCPWCTISPDDIFMFFSCDTKHRKWDLATTWLGAKTHIWHMGGVWHFGEGKKCPPQLLLTKYAQGLHGDVFYLLPLSKGRHVNAPFKKTGIVLVSVSFALSLSFSVSSIHLRLSSPG